MTLSAYSLEQDKSFHDQRRPRRSQRAGVRSQRQVSLPVRIDRRRAGARLVRAIHRRQLAARATSISSCCATICRRRSRGRATRRSRRPAASTAGRRPPHRHADAARRPRHRRAGAHRFRGHRIPHPRSADSRRAICRTCRPATRTTFTTCARAPIRRRRRRRPGPPDRRRSALHRFDLAKRQDEQLLDNVARLPRLGRRQEAALREPRRLVDRAAAGAQGQSRRRPARRRRPRGARSIRAPNGRRSSTRRGGSTATTSTRPTCTASTGRR